MLVVYVVEKCNELQCPHGPHAQLGNCQQLETKVCDVCLLC